MRQAGTEEEEEDDTGERRWEQGQEGMNAASCHRAAIRIQLLLKPDTNVCIPCTRVRKVTAAGSNSVSRTTRWRADHSSSSGSRMTVMAARKYGKGAFLSILLEQVSAPTPRYIPAPRRPGIENDDTEKTDVCDDAPGENDASSHNNHSPKRLSLRERIDYGRLSFLQELDPRVKIAYAILIAIAPSLIKSSALTASSLTLIKFSLCFVIGTLSLLWLPMSTAAPMVRRAVVIALLAYVGSVLGADSISPPTQSRGLTPELDPLSSSLPVPNCSYRYTVLSFGPFHITQRGLKLAASSSTLAFCLLQTASLVMSTTTPEQMAAGIGAMIISPAAKIMRLLGIRRAREQASELIVMFLLSLRFLDIVFQEGRNIALGVATRGIKWRELGVGKSIMYIASLIGRFFRSMFDVSISISEAMVARGFTGMATSGPGHPQTSNDFMAQYTLTEMKMKPVDYFMSFMLVMLLAGAWISNL